MDKQLRGQEPDVKSLERIVIDLATQLGVEPEIIRPLLIRAYQDIMAVAVVKDFVSIFAMRLVRDRFSGEKGRNNRQGERGFFD